MVLLLGSNANAEFSKGTNMLKIAENMSPTYDFTGFDDEIIKNKYIIVWRANKRHTMGMWHKGFNKASFNQKFYLGKLKPDGKVKTIWGKKSINRHVKQYVLMETFANKQEVLNYLYSIVSDRNKIEWVSTLASKNNVTLSVVEEERQRAEEEKQRAEAIASGDISFTIDDKKKKCEAIGFEPQTEKFADCVLRLVELDVKSQQQKQIELAISQGNQQVANELKAQRNQQRGQYLTDLGQKLLNPPTKKTTRCTVTGTGSFRTVRCR